MLALRVDGLEVRLLRPAFLHQRLVLRLRLHLVGLRGDSHNSDLLLSIDQQLLGVSLGRVNVVNSVGLNLVHNDTLLTFSLRNQNRCVFLGLLNLNTHCGLCSQLILLLVYLCSVNLHLKFVHSSLVLPLHVGKDLRFLILKLQSLVLLFFLVILELELDFGPFFKGFTKCFIDKDVGDIALFKDDSVSSKLTVQRVHHGVGHIRF